MGSKRGNFIGLAGEFRVMSELLLREHNPAKSYLNDGIDIVLENGKRIEVKSAHKLSYGKWLAYHFSFRGGRGNKLQNLNNCDFIICWCIEDNDFYIIPIDELGAPSLSIHNNFRQSSKYLKYRDAWELLEK